MNSNLMQPHTTQGTKTHLGPQKDQKNQGNQGIRNLILYRTLGPGDLRKEKKITIPTDHKIRPVALRVLI